MTTLDDEICALTEAVAGGSVGLDEALGAVEDWLANHIARMDEQARTDFRGTLDQPARNDTASLVDSVLRLHATRLLYRYDVVHDAPSPAGEEPSSYTEARNTFNATLRQSEDGLREARIDVAIANAHHLLGDVDANRHWLETALNHLQPLAPVDLIALAVGIPAMPLPNLTGFRRMGLRVLGVNLNQLSERNRESFVALAQLQTHQLIVLAHLVGVSFEAIRERQRASRAFRIVAHLIARHNGMPGVDAAQALEIAEDIFGMEADAARLLARQAFELYRTTGDSEGQGRARALLQR